jgi:two-component system nitrogen regulation response regulator GlnG
MPVLLVIDDDASIQEAFRAIFEEPGVTLLTATTGREGLQLIGQRRPDAILLDLALPDLPGLEVFRRIQQHDARIPVIFITGHGTTDTAIEAMRLGAFEYLLKPLELGQLRELIDRAFAIGRLMHTPAVVSAEEAAPEPADVLVGRCPAMQEVYKAIGRVAPQDVTVLISGESGTGKELVARAIYHYSRRSAHPFLAINCAAIPEMLLESELFGHERGAFTGADRKRIGKFEQCSGGTLFLDEIGDMTLVTQAKILRVLQEQRFERVGGNETIQTNVRVLAATNRDLEQMLAAGQFRSDLYYRLNVVTIPLPPLRERREDLPLLVEHFLRRFSRELGKNITRATPETLEILQRHPWPGNLRELQSVLKQALLQASGSVLVPDFLPAALRGLGKSPMPDGAPPPPRPTFPDWEGFLDERLLAGSLDLHAEWLALAERYLFTRVLHQTRGNQLQAAKILGISRNCLRAKIRTLGITIGRSVSSDVDPLDGPPPR